MRLFSRLGEAGKEFRKFTDEEKKHIFAVIERGKRFKYSKLVFFVACGTLGGIMWVSGSDRLLVRQISSNAESGRGHIVFFLRS